MPLALRGKLAWAHDFADNPWLNASFQSLPGTGFIVNGAPIPHNSALVSGGAELYLAPRLVRARQIRRRIRRQFRHLRRHRNSQIYVVAIPLRNRRP